MPLTAPQSPPVDLVHLSRYTGGDTALNAEVLQLFVNQAAELMTQLNSVLKTGDVKNWHHVTHSMKGAARGIGAFALADVAASAEPIDPVRETENAASAVRALAAQAEAVRLFVDAYLGH